MDIIICIAPIIVLFVSWLLSPNVCLADRRRGRNFTSTYMHTKHYHIE